MESKAITSFPKVLFKKMIIPVESTPRPPTPLPLHPVSARNE